MAIEESFAGTVYAPSAVYEVSREKIAEFAAAVGSADPVHTDPEAARALGYDDVVAPPTFAVAIAQRCEAQYVSDPAAGVDFSRVVHGEESFVHHRPIVAGMRLVPTLHVDAARQRGPVGMVTTRVELADESGDPVSTVVSMLVVRGES